MAIPSGSHPFGSGSVSGNDLARAAGTATAKTAASSIRIRRIRSFPPRRLVPRCSYRAQPWTDLTFLLPYPQLMILYNSPVSGNCYKVRLLLAHLALDVELRDVSVVDRSNRKELLGDLNPARRVPTLVLDDGRPLAESNAILWYFGEGTRFVPADRYERAQVLQWMFFEQYDHEPAIAVARFLKSYSGRPELYEARK